MVNLYVFGNEFLEGDSLARKISNHLHNVEIIHCKSPEDLLDAEDEDILILDVVKGISETTLITDVKTLKTRNIISLHDFDLGFFLNLLKKLNMTKNIKIIGIPAHGDEEKILEDVKQMIDNTANDDLGSTDGLDLIVRFAFSPTDQGKCAVKENIEIFMEYLLNDHRNALDTNRIIGTYPNMMAYLNFIAEKLATSPFNSQVAEAYIFGNTVLDGTNKEDIIKILDGLRRKGLFTKANYEGIVSKLPHNVFPHHNFYVFHVSHLGQMGMHEFTLERMDNCRVSYGKVIRIIDDEHIAVETDTLGRSAKGLALSPAEKTIAYNDRFIQPKPDDYVAIHWTYAFSLITAQQRKNLDKYTKLLLE